MHLGLGHLCYDLLRRVNLRLILSRLLVVSQSGPRRVNCVVQSFGSLLLINNDYLVLGYLFNDLLRRVNLRTLIRCLSVYSRV